MRVIRVVVAALVLSACNVNTTASPSSSSFGTLPPSASPAGSPMAPPSSGAGVVIDASLLDVLPAEVDGLPITETPETEADFVTDPELGEVAEAAAAGIAVDQPSSEFVYAVVVRLKSGVMGDERFRDWRDTYDDGACSQAGGVVGHAQAEIAGRTVYIGTCDGGVRTYHVWLREQNLLVSASAVGEQRRLGEKLVEGLRP